MFSTVKYLVLAVLLFNFGAYAQKIQSPEAFLGQPLGTQFTGHHKLVAYFEYVAKENPTATKLFHIGNTSEERPQLLAAISSPDNIAHLEELRTNHLKRIGIAKGTPTSLPAVAIVWLGYSVHGNEPAGSETAMQLLYELNNLENTTLNAYLKNTIVLIDPSQNPDGYDRYVQWYKDVCSTFPNTDRNSIEHQEPWPTGRVNHYLFDLNRDWAWATQIETQQRLQYYKQWMPHVHPDIHEQSYNAPYYFAPAAEPFHQYISPFQREFQTNVGKNHAKYFDKNGWLYFTKEIFDLLYPSYGDTYPSFNGAVGMTYEQGGIGAGRAIIIENGDSLLLSDRIAHHYTTSISTIEMTSKNAALLEAEMEAYFKKRATNPIGEYKTYIIKGTNDASKLAKLTKLLDMHHIQYGATNLNTKMSGFDYIQQKEVSFPISSNDLIISAHQPLSTLAQVLFDPNVALSDSLTYDITTWALPYAWGLEAYSTKQSISIDKDFSLTAQTIAIDNTSVPYAYLCEWKSVTAARFLAQALKSGIIVRTATMPFEIAQKKYEAGTLIINRADNKGFIGMEFANLLNAVASQEGVAIQPVYTGLVSAGYDFGSSKMGLIKSPRVAIVGGEGVNNTAFGHLWYYFEKDLNYPVSVLSTERFRKFNLDQYDILVLPDGNYNFEAPQIEKIKNWANNGGKIIALEEAITLFEDQKGFALTKYADKKAKESAEEKAEKDNMIDRLDTYCNQERKAIGSLIPGAIFKIKIDNTHPLGFGLPKQYFSLKTNTLHYTFLKEGANVGHIEGTPETIGFAGNKAKAIMKNTLTFGTQPIGKGTIVYMIDSPVFRGFWEQGKLLMSNAIFMPNN